MTKELYKNKLYFALVTILTGMILLAIGIDGPISMLKGFLQIQIHPSRLINDYFIVGGIGGALFNASLVGIIGLFIISITGISLSGPTFAAVLTMTGFGLFGKTSLNVIPIILGVFLAAKIVNKSYKEYLLIALFGTALGPLVNTLIWETGLSLIYSLPLGLIVGICTGLLLPAIAFAMLHLHQGYNLYNMGLSCGFLGLFAFSMLKGFGTDYNATLLWSNKTSLPMVLLIPLLSLFLILLGLLPFKKKTVKDFFYIQTLSGRLPSDFTDLASPESTLVNSGIIGLLFSLYIWIIGGDFNGPVIGGLFTIIGFAAFGTHIKNSWPVILGVIIATLVSGQSLTSPGPLLALIFSTTLSPLAGEFGVKAGVIAGFIHMLLVSQTTHWYGGINLYNNGFAGGLTATFLIAVIQWYKSNKEEI
ncbi:DUF1576 domain-containing protein [Spirochaeta cellobiosiphila]|uniref:DUF1576 domain-containing protein n=1 Tax=Spirochaeta cellobiosiphila TaxID=504483 RepID=UPI000404858F|nr:DUF1576 domain-containing protein [Spirochaeta cellobiosiphila]